MFGKLSVTVINCENFEEMTSFYRDRIGLPVLAERPMAVTFGTGNGGELVLSNKPQERFIKVGFTDADIEAAHENLSELVPHHNGQSFEVRDPDGNTLVFVND